MSVAVHIDYHVEFDGHYCSVSYSLVHKRVDLRGTASTVECFYQGQRVASHPRSYVRGKHSTIDEHRPKAHRHVASWTPERLVRWASTVGPETADLAHAATSVDARPSPASGRRQDGEQSTLEGEMIKSSFL